MGPILFYMGIFVSRRKPAPQTANQPTNMLLHLQGIKQVWFGLFFNQLPAGKTRGFPINNNKKPPTKPNPRFQLFLGKWKQSCWHG